MISASAVTLASRCLRRAAFKYGSDVEPAPEEEPAAVTLGKEGHAILEAYQKAGTSPPRTPIGDLCRKGLPWLPAPGQANAEGQFNVTISGVPYLGFIDLATPDHRVLPGITEGGLPAVIDYKFSKDPKRYGIREPRDFLLDPQALLYAAYMFVRYGTSRVFLRWLKFQTQGRPTATPVDATLTRRQVTEAFGRVIHPTASVLLRIRDKDRDPNSFAPNYEACHDFGRVCPYLGQCQRTASVTLLDDMRNLVEAPASTPAVNTNGYVAPSDAPLDRCMATPPLPLRVILEELGQAFTRAANRL
jgi:hypothetical protein